MHTTPAHVAQEPETKKILLHVHVSHLELLLLIGQIGVCFPTQRWRLQGRLDVSHHRQQTVKTGNELKRQLRKDDSSDFGPLSMVGING